jgi:hypothetical protein
MQQQFFSFESELKNNNQTGSPTSRPLTPSPIAVGLNDDGFHRVSFWNE